MSFSIVFLSDQAFPAWSVSLPNGIRSLITRKPASFPQQQTFLSKCLNLQWTWSNIYWVFHHKIQAGINLVNWLSCILSNKAGAHRRIWHDENKLLLHKITAYLAVPLFANQSQVYKPVREKISRAERTTELNIRSILLDGTATYEREIIPVLEQFK